MKRRGKALLAITALFAFLVFVTTALAETSAGSCPNEEMRTGKSAQLPECRAYEQVSPVEKEYSVFGGFPFFAYTGKRSGAVAFTAEGPLSGSKSGNLQNVYLSQRTASGWSLTPLDPPQELVPGAGALPSVGGFSSDLLQTTFLTANPPLVPEADRDLANLYVRETGPETWRLLTTPQLPEEKAQIRYLGEAIGASSDFSHVVFSFFQPLIGGAGDLTLYENVGGELRNVGILPNGEPAELARAPIKDFHLVSDDGSRIYFDVGGNRGHLYLREDASRTVEASASHRTPPDPTSVAEVTFWAATADGSQAFFTSKNALTNDATVGTDSEGNPTDVGENLYRFNAETEELTDLSVDANPADAEAGSRVLGVVGASDDGTRVYFVARGELAEGATSGSPNLYLWEEGTVRFLAQLNSDDSQNWTPSVSFLTSRVSPDGRHLLVSSTARLTAYDNTDASSGLPDREIYLYSTGTGEIACVSCRPDGTAPEAATSIRENTNSWQNANYYNRYMTDDGKLVVFDTTEPLLPRDTNGRRDVYAYSEGQLKLLSTGRSEFESQFGDMSPDGSDVFIGTAEQLVGSDSDQTPDLYDVRVGGGFAQQAAPVAPCSGGECVRNGSAPPSQLLLGTTSFSGSGNAKGGRKKRCGRHAHRVRRHGKVRCVKKHHVTKRGGHK